jgi:hypothetical protein
MTNKEFKKQFTEVAKKYGFVCDFGGWYKITLDCIITIHFQKSQFGNSYIVSFGVLLKKAFDKEWLIDKNNKIQGFGHIFTGVPNEFKEIFYLNNSIDDDSRIKRIEKLFVEFVNPYSDHFITRETIIKSCLKGEIFIIPRTKKELGII